MTNADTTAASAAGNTDAPTATVPVGASEYVAYITALAALLNGIFGHDYHLAANAQAASVLVAGLVLSVQGISRAIKHHAAMHANAAVYAAQLLHVTHALSGNGGSITPASIAAGVSALNQAVAVDTAVKAPPSPS